MNPCHDHSLTPPVIQSNVKLKLDKLTVCSNDKNEQNVESTIGLILSDKVEKSIPGLFVSKGRRYELACRIPVPFTESLSKEYVIFEAGPRHAKLPSYRCEFNPDKIGDDGLNDMLAFIDSCVDAHHVEFFRGGIVTRVDVALDLPGQSLDSRIVRTTRLQKHGVYSNRHGDPETVYLGTPKSRRVVVYDKRDSNSLLSSLRLEVRLKPGCFGYQIASLKNPFAEIQLIPSDFPDAAGLGIPSQFVADSIRLGGLKRALFPLAPKDRKALKRAYVEATSTLPDAQHLWESWSDTLVACGLGQHLGVLSHSEQKAA